MGPRFLSPRQLRARGVQTEPCPVVGAPRGGAQTSFLNDPHTCPQGPLARGGSGAGDAFGVGRWRARQTSSGGRRKASQQAGLDGVRVG